MVYHFLLSLCGNESLAEELTSETLYQAYLHIGQFRGDCKIETWLCQIAKNALIKEQKRRSRLVSPDTLKRTVGDTDFFESLANKEQALQRIQLILVKCCYGMLMIRIILLLLATGKSRQKKDLSHFQT